MSNFVTLSAIGAPEPDFSSFPKDFSVYEKEIKNFLKKQIDKVLNDKPDLIVFPECANRYQPNTKLELKEYYAYLGDSITEFLKPIAVQNNTNIAYSAVHLATLFDEKPFLNSTIYINRKGEICGAYNKNHIMAAEYELADIKYGTEANLINLDFGNVASAICFDLNFDELMCRYKVQKPDLIVFSSMYHGGLMRQAQWAYTCRSYFIGAICEKPCTILNPYGNIIATSTNYTDYISTKVNLDYVLCHFDYNYEKLDAVKNKYKDAVTVYDPGYVGSVMLSVNIPGITANDVAEEFEIQLLDDYLDEARAHRNKNI